MTDASPEVSQSSTQFPDVIRTAEPPNPWKARLEKQGIIFGVPERFTRLSKFPPGSEIDPRSGLVKETDAIREMEANNLTESIKNGKKSAKLTQDVDNLKQANSYPDNGRKLGDMVIPYGASKLARLIDSLNISPNSKIILVRPGDSADEAEALLTELEDEDILKIQNGIADMQGDLLQDPQGMTLSVSTAVITSDSPELQEEIAEARKSLEQDPNYVAWDLYNKTCEVTNREVGLIKWRKDVGRLKLRELAREGDPDKVNNAILDTLGNSRSSRPLLKMALEYSNSALILQRAYGGNDLTLQRDLRAAGIDYDTLLTIDTPEKMAEFYKTAANFFKDSR